MSSYDWFGSVGTLPIGYALVGPLSGVLGIDGALWLAVVVWTAASLVVLTVPSVRHLTDEPDAHDEPDVPAGPTTHPSPVAVN